MSLLQPVLSYLTPDRVLALGTVVIAVFTYLVWRVHDSDHKIRYFARLQVCWSAARYDSHSKTIRVEVLLLNSSDAPAVVSGWEILVRDGTFQQSVADGTLGPTKLMKVPAFMNGRGWVLERRLPTALAIAHALAKDIGKAAIAEVEVHYAGGRKELQKLRHSVRIEIV